MKSLFGVLVISILWMPLVVAQNRSAAFLSKLEGVWLGKGTAMGAASDVTMEWSKILGDKFYKINYKMQISNNGSNQVFEGMGLYRYQKEEGYDGTWFDNGGEMHHIKSSDDGKTLISYWGEPGKKYGKTEYELIDKKTIQVRDAIQNKNGDWRQFATSTLIKREN